MQAIMLAWRGGVRAPVIRLMGPQECSGRVTETCTGVDGDECVAVMYNEQEKCCARRNVGELRRCAAGVVVSGASGTSHEQEEE